MVDGKVSVVFLTRKSAASMFLAKKIAENKKINLKMVITESISTGNWTQLRKKLSNRLLKKRYLSALSLILTLPYYYFLKANMRKFLSKNLKQGPTFSTENPVVEVKNLNDDETKSALESLSPDIIFVFGTRILKKSVFSLAGIATVNVHLGITPKYRGVQGEFWALFNKSYEDIGFTVHQIDEGVDTGGVYHREYIEHSYGDNEKNLRLKNILRCGEVLPSILIKIALGELKARPISQSDSKQYFSPSFLQYVRLHWRVRLRGR